MIARWPGWIPKARVSDKVVTSLDLAPTLVAMAGDIKPIKGVDGRDVRPWFYGKNGVLGPNKPFYYFWEQELRAVRQGRWKLQIEHIDAQTPDPKGIGRGGVRGNVIRRSRPQALYDLSIDPSETNDLSSRHSDQMKAMLELAKEGRAIKKE